MDSRGGDRFGARRRPWGDRHYSRTRGRECRRMCKRRPPGICEWLREPLRRSCALRSAAGLLRAHAVRPTTAPERQRVCELQRPVGQRRRVQLSPSPIRAQRRRNSRHRRGGRVGGRQPRREPRSDRAGLAASQLTPAINSATSLDRSTADRAACHYGCKTNLPRVCCCSSVR
jgi:hypothetical protein